MRLRTLYEDVCKTVETRWTRTSHVPRVCSLADGVADPVLDIGTLAKVIQYDVPTRCA